MAKNININRSVNDPFYRYKMPKILAKVEGKGNGIKTVIANMTEIAKALARPPTYPTKYFGCELGAQTNFDLKNDRYIVNGEHDAAKLQDILDGFIRKFVLCPACDNPETTLNVKPKSQVISGKCKACGHLFTVDPKQKLSTFILKNPPPNENSEAESKEKRDGSPAGEAADECQESNGNCGLKESDEDISDDWAPEPLEESETKISAQVGKLIIDKDLDKSMEDRLDMLHQFFVAAKKDGSIQDWKKILNEAERLELKTKAPLLLARVMFDANILKQISETRNLLLRFCNNDQKAQRYLLGGVEQLVLSKRDCLLPKTAHIIKTLYDSDLCDEEVLLHWGEKPSSKYVSKDFAKEMIKVAQPVLTWLREAEEEEDESDVEQSDEDTVNFDSRQVYTSEAAMKAVAAKESLKAVKDENDEDVDIDTI